MGTGWKGGRKEKQIPDHKKMKIWIEKKKEKKKRNKP